MSLLTMIPPAAVLEADFRALGADIRSFRVPLERAVRQVAIPSIRENFDVGGRPPWQPLSDATLAQRSREGSGGDILVRTGALRQVATQLNLWSYTREEARVDSIPEKVGYGNVHQKGSQFIPERPFIVLQDGDIDDIADIFEEWLGERLGDHGFRIEAL